SDAGMLFGPALQRLADLHQIHLHQRITTGRAVAVGAETKMMHTPTNTGFFEGFTPRRFERTKLRLDVSFRDDPPFSCARCDQQNLQSARGAPIREDARLPGDVV